jgi:HEAT repeat protein
MQKDRSFWPSWAHFLQQWGLAEVAAVLLEAASPLHVFLAQMVYAGRPFLGQTASEERVSALANLLESQEESRSFAAFIREESSR